MSDFYKEILDGLADVVIVKDQNNGVVYSNKDDDNISALIDMGNNMYKDERTGNIYQKQTIKLGKDKEHFTIERYADVTILNDSIQKYGIDHLTKLPVRAKIDEYLQTIEATRRNYVFAMIDIDNFKHVNDTYGHDMGDEVLTTIAQILYKNLRRDDFAGRYGGEEFLLIFESNDKYSVCHKLNYIREMIEETNFNANGETFNVTISAGVSKYERFYHTDSYKEKIKEADEALYYIKENGKNAVGTKDVYKNKYVKELSL